MKPVAKFFNTAGPIKPEIHYNVDPLARINVEEIEQLIHQQKYFVLHAPRQTGKTSYLLALRDYLNARGEFCVVYANVEAGKAYRNDIQTVENIVVSQIAEKACTVLHDDLPRQLYERVRKKKTNGTFISSYLKTLSNALDKPLVLLIDEIDSLVGDSLISVLRQIRSGYDQRPLNFPQSIILCSMQNIKDHRIMASEQGVITEGSFNIKATSLQLGSFNPKEIHELYLQHTTDTGQEFDEDCFPLIWTATKGQPWLVNALANEVTMEMEENRDRSIRIIPEMIYRAQERIINRKVTHINEPIDKLQKEIL